MEYKRLEQLRLESGLTKREIALNFNVAESTYGKWELGKRKPDTNTIIELADFFNVSADYLLGISDNPRPHKSEHFFVENGQKYVRKYNYLIGQNETFVLDEDGNRTPIEKTAPTELTPMEAAIAYFYADKGRYPTQEEIDLFIAFTKPVLDSLPDKKN